MAVNHIRERGAHIQQLLGFLTPTHLHCCHTYNQCRLSLKVARLCGSFTTFQHSCAVPPVLMSPRRSEGDPRGKGEGGRTLPPRRSVPSED